ncbi:hypothetical protein ADEAN_000238000 [Angomonas deanei]|uniref:PH-like domain-containing protein n=1 Tax=Angomonas deanei TaxID=59799 RepID=A0A7G2C7Z1_9TRYP|nr:hypothetical protein ADEAN_000238000 [Angomonas deanei]
MSQHSYPSNSRGRVVRYVGAVNRRPDGEGDDGAVSVSSAPTSRVERPLRRLPAPVPQPSPLLKAIVEHICYYRNIASPPVIYPEVAVAFDEFIHRGTLLKKFIERGPPHSRFFCIRFLDLNLPRQDMGPSMNVPEPVLGYYTNEKSRSMRRFFPLVNLVKVSAPFR